MDISKTPIKAHSNRSMDLSEGGCAQSCASRKRDREWDTAMTITDDGQMHTSQTWDCSLWLQPTDERANPDEETTNWRAVCGRTARTVRRQGRRRPSLPLSAAARSTASSRSRKLARPTCPDGGLVGHPAAGGQRQVYWSWAPKEPLASPPLPSCPFAVARGVWRG